MSGLISFSFSHLLISQTVVSAQGGLWVTKQENPGLCARSGGFLQILGQTRVEDGKEALRADPARAPSGSSYPRGAWEASAQSTAPPESVLPEGPSGGAQLDRGYLLTSRSGTQQECTDNEPAIPPQARSLAPGAERLQVRVTLGVCQPARDPALLNFRGQQQGRKWGVGGGGGAWVAGRCQASAPPPLRPARPVAAPPAPPRPPGPQAQQLSRVAGRVAERGARRRGEQSGSGEGGPGLGRAEQATRRAFVSGGAGAAAAGAGRPERRMRCLAGRISERCGGGRRGARPGAQGHLCA